MTTIHRVVLPALVAIGLAVATPAAATDPAAPAAPAAEAKQAKYILHVDGMT